MTVVELRKSIDATLAMKVEREHAGRFRFKREELCASVLRAIANSNVSRATVRGLAEEALRLFE